MYRSGREQVSYEHADWLALSLLTSRILQSLYGSGLIKPIKGILIPWYFLSVVVCSPSFAPAVLDTPTKGKTYGSGQDPSEEGIVAVMFAHKAQHQ